MPESKALHILLLPGDGIGPEISRQCERLLEVLRQRFALKVSWEIGLIGGAAIDAMQDPFPQVTVNQTENCDAVLLACVGGPKWDGLDRKMRPETGLLRIRKSLGLFANIRPVNVFPSLVDASPLKKDRIEGVDLVIVRELTSGVYFGQPRGQGVNGAGEVFAQNNMIYTETEIERIAHLAFGLARGRRKIVHSIDKANVLEVSQLWRDVVTRVHAAQYPDVRLEHQYVDSASMQLIRNPQAYDVILTENLFGDILSDEAAVLPGSIGLLPSASLTDRSVTSQRCRGLFEPVHGSAPDIAGRGIANPLALFLSLAMLFRHASTAATDYTAAAHAIETAVESFFADGHRTPDTRTSDTPASHLHTTSSATDLIIQTIGPGV